MAKPYSSGVGIFAMQAWLLQAEAQAALHARRQIMGRTR
jgi:hypothetical protein